MSPNLCLFGREAFVFPGVELLTENAQAHLDEQAAALDAAWCHLGARIGTNSDTGHLSEFTHTAGGPHERRRRLPGSRARAEATNVGYKPIARDNHTALSRARLSHVEQNYLRADRLKVANARLIEAQADLPLAQLWGGGMVASIDGLRFVVPTQTIHAGHNGTQRDSLHRLDVLLNPDHGRRPDLVTSDTAGYSDMVFGLYRICGPGSLFPSALGGKI